MKKIFFLLFIAVSAAVGRGQNLVITNTGWSSPDAFAALAVTNYPDDDGDGGPVHHFAIPSAPVIAEAITPEIQALADGLQDDPLRIFNYVHDHIRYVLYFGSKKGAALTLLEKSGNDFDQSALLVALLHAAGYTDAAYQFGWMVFPYDNPDGSHRDLHHWLGTSFTNSDWSTTSLYLNTLFRTYRLYPTVSYNPGVNNQFMFQRVWVTLPIGGTTNYLDPAFKVSEPIAGLDNLPSAMGFDSNTLSSALGGTVVGNLGTNFYVTNLNEANLRTNLKNCATSLVSYLQNTYPNFSVAQVIGGQYIVPSTLTNLPQTLLFPTTNQNGHMPVLNWTYQPTNMMSVMTLGFLHTNITFFMPQLQGQRLTLTVSNNGFVRLWAEDNVIGQGDVLATGGTFINTNAVLHPGYWGWDPTNNVITPGYYGKTTHISYQAANATYGILYSFEPDWGWLERRQKQLDAYRQQGRGDTSREVVSESLNIMGLNWMLQTESLSEILARQVGTLHMNFNAVGRMAQESGRGYYVDIYDGLNGDFSSYSYSSNPNLQFLFEWSFLSSAMEHGLIEQLQSSNLVAASTVKILELAATNNGAIYMANTTNWTTVQTHLSGYSGALSAVSAYVGAGYTVLLPQNGLVQINGTGSWSGYGFAANSPSGTGMLIGNSSGDFSGGFVSDYNATVNPPFIDYSAYSQPTYFNSTPISVPNFTGADPVNMADGTFQVQNTDLSIGQTEPRGLSFSRYYSSNRRNNNLAGISPGWIHNYYLNAAAISAPQASLGGTTPAQMAPLIVATTAITAMYNPQPDPKNWMIAALTAKWAIDQITSNAVSVTLGQDTVQFIKQPDGTYTPPANSTMTLSVSNSAYQLQERHGRTFQFNPAGWATNIVDQYNQSLKLVYNSSNWVTSATDWQNRSLTFAYGGTPSRLTGVSDSTGRSVSLGYSSSNDLVSVGDPEGKTNTFFYDTNHQIIVVSDALGQVVTSNNYDAFGRVTNQFTQGDTNKKWNIFWSGWQTVTQDPMGGQETYFYDDQSRLIAKQDALGNLSQTAYDGQNHIVLTVSPMNELNQFIYDGQNNLVASIDPLGFTNSFVYDTQNNLIRTVDQRGFANSFGYNAKFQLIESTNGAGDAVTNTYDSTTGTLSARADSAGSTTYTYDGLGQLNAIIYPGSLGTNGFLNSTNGDVLSFTNGRGFVTSFQYNNRRQLIKTTAPTNLITQVQYDAVGNAGTNVDALSNNTVATWSPTRHLMTATLPAASAGTAVFTNSYDSRDWLILAKDPLQNPTRYSNDLAGRSIALIDPLARTNSFGYDNDGRRLYLTNGLGQITTQQWNSNSQLVKIIDPATNLVLTAYDQAGNQTTLTNRNSNVWQFQYDGAGRSIIITSPRSAIYQQILNHEGLVATNLLPGTTTTFLYDARNRLTNRTDGVGTTTYRYDANNNCTQVIEAGNTNSWAFDAYDRVISYTNIDGSVIQYRYDASHNLTNLIYPDGRGVTNFYDTLNHLTKVIDWAGRQTTFTYDLAGRLTSIIRPNGTVRSNYYDAAGQLTNIVEQAASRAPIAFFVRSFDNAGRIKSEFTAPLPHAYTPPARTITVDADNRLATFNGQNVTNDADGDMTGAPLTNSSFINYVYDARHRLFGAYSCVYAYDAFDNRTTVTTGSSVASFINDPNALLPQVLMRIKSGVTNYYVYGNGLLYEVTETATTTNTATYHYDSRGSTVALTDDNANITDRIEYSAYGMTTFRAGTNDTPFLYNGRHGVQTDANGLLYMRARYYNPYLCRFINADPSGFSGGLNFYAYANGNPVSYLDPFGLGAVGENSTSTWIQLGNVLTSGDTWWGHLLYTGQLNPSDDVMEAAVNAAGDYVYDNGGVRGFYGGVGLNSKVPGKGSLAGQIGVTGTWTVDAGYGAEIDSGLGLQERGYTANGTVSQTVGVGGSYQFYSQDNGFQAPSFGSSGSVQAPAIYGGIGNRVGGANFAIQNQNNAALGINYGAGYGGIIIDPSKVWGNFVDSFHIITGTSEPSK